MKRIWKEHYPFIIFVVLWVSWFAYKVSSAAELIYHDSDYRVEIYTDTCYVTEFTCDDSLIFEDGTYICLSYHVDTTRYVREKAETIGPREGSITIDSLMFGDYGIEPNPLGMFVDTVITVDVCDSFIVDTNLVAENDDTLQVGHYNSWLCVDTLYDTTFVYPWEDE